MKLSPLTLFGLAGFVIGQDNLQPIKDAVKAKFVFVEDGNQGKPFICKESTKWTLWKMGNTTDTEDLQKTTSETTESRYTLNNNELTIKANKKDRSMMGIIEASGPPDSKSCLFTIGGRPVFDNLANSLTNLNDDNAKRMDCAVKGYPLPSISWRFQAIDQDYVSDQCGNKIGAETCDCTDEAKCEPQCNGDPTCEAQFYKKNSTGLFNVPFIANQIQVRYSPNSNGQCPMGTGEIDEKEFSNCKIVNSEKEIDGLANNMKLRSQLFFENVKYEQRGKYICVATQSVKDIDMAQSDRAKAFIWRVKDPVAALWPFLALVAEVMIVVCIILYYEKASAAKKESENDEEGGEFLDKKEES